MDSSTPTEPKTAPETMFGGRYRILGRIGQGTMGTVYQAILEEFPTEVVALKILSQEGFKDRKTFQRFQNEMRICSRISHPNVVNPIEVLREKNSLGYSMEYVAGGNLMRLLGDRNLQYYEVCRIIKEIASALQAVHGSGVIHRDVKPENILLTEKRAVKLSDFGTALLIGGPRVTSEGDVLGSIPYLSPEYVENQQLDERSDLYSLGAVLYELLTGSVPYKMDTLIGIINGKLYGSELHPRDVRSDLPVPLENAVLRLLARAPEDRYQSAKTVEDEFRLLERELTPQIPAPEVGSDAP